MTRFFVGNLGSNTTRTFLDSVNNAAPSDNFRFVLGAPANLNLSLTGMTQDADLRLYRDVNNNGIIDAGDGGPIASSVQGGSADDSINTRLTSAGTYIAQVARFGGSNTNYTLRMSNTGFSPSNLLPTEINAGTLTAVPFSSFNSLGTNDAADTFRFTMGTAGNFNAALTGIAAGNDLDMRLIRDANGNGIVDAGDVRVSATAGGNNDDSINVRSLAAGNYFLQTYLYSGTNSNYTLRMSNTGFSPSNLLPTEINAGTLTAVPFNTFNSLGTNDAADTFRFTMGTAGNFNAALTGITAGNDFNDFDMRLIRDANGNGIVDAGDVRVSATAGGNNDDAINVRSLAAGNYFLQTYLYSGSGGGYNLKMSNTGISGGSPSNLLPTEVNVGTVGFLTGSTTRTGSVGVDDAADTFRFGVAFQRSVRLTLSGLSADADLRLIRDGNNNGIVDAGEELRRSAFGGTTSEVITQTLAQGNYIAQVYHYPTTGSTSYALNIA